MVVQSMGKHVSDTMQVSGNGYLIDSLDLFAGTMEHKITHPTGTTGGIGGTVAHVKAQIPGASQQ